MPYNDLRDFLSKLDAEGELSHVKAQVDWNLEIGAITRRALDLKARVPLFENVKDYPQGYRVLAHPIGPTKPIPHGRVALAMDLPKDTPTSRIIDEFGKRCQGAIRPVRVSSGPCKENIKTGDEVDLLQFPAPLQHEMDGGRYFGTWNICVTRDPDSGWVNWGTYRMMLLSKNTLSWLAFPSQHGPSIYYQKYEARGQAMPMAVVLGAEPVSHIVASSQLPENVDEADVAGAIRGAPVELVKCETIDLEVPATAEIVLEGEVRPYERETEGPFGEYTGYCSGDRGPRPVFHVNCVTFRDDPIFTISVPGKVWDGDAPLFSIVSSAILQNELRSRGFPVKAVYSIPPSMAVCVSISPKYPGHAHTIASAVWSTRVGLGRPFVFVVGDDVDVTDVEDVLWCLTTRVHPDRGIHVQRNVPIGPLFPPISREEREKRLASRVFFDGTFPVEWSNEETPAIVDLEHAWPAEVRNKVLERWEEYGI